MITNVCQRWKLRKAKYRRPDEQIQASRYEVASIPDDTTAKAFVIAHHYESSYPAARRRFGMYEGDELVGVAVFSHPMNAKVLHIFPGDLKMSMELGRLVLLDRVPGNGESWFVARCFELLRLEGMIGIVSFSDPMPRRDVAGGVTFCGHIGITYQSLNAVYVGRSTAKYKRVLPDGRMMSDRAISKIRKKDQGWVYSAAILQRFGASEPDPDNLLGWLKHWLPRLTRPVYHPGNYEYCWSLQRKYRKKLPVALDYPKVKITA